MRSERFANKTPIHSFSSRRSKLPTKSPKYGKLQTASSICSEFSYGRMSVFSSSERGEISGVRVISRIRPYLLKEVREELKGKGELIGNKSMAEIVESVKGCERSVCVLDSKHLVLGAGTGDGDGSGGSGSGGSGSGSGGSGGSGGKGRWKIRMDAVYGEGDGQVDIYTRELSSWVQRVIGGGHIDTGGLEDIRDTPTPNRFNLIAYGLSNTGKSHTLFGSKSDSSGLLQQTLADVFACGAGLKVGISLLQICDEKINNLLRGRKKSEISSSMGTPFRRATLLQEGEGKDLVFCNRTKVKFGGGELAKYLPIIQKCLNAGTESTQPYIQSHTLCILEILREGVVIGVLYLLEVGSEDRHILWGNRGEGSGSRGVINIGKILHALRVGQHTHVPYQFSKIGKILKDCINHQRNTVLITHLSPSESYLMHNLHLLKYTSKRKKYISGGMNIDINMNIKSPKSLKSLKSPNIQEVNRGKLISPLGRLREIRRSGNPPVPKLRFNMIPHRIGRTIRKQASRRIRGVCKYNTPNKKIVTKGGSKSCKNNLKERILSRRLGGGGLRERLDHMQFGIHKVEDYLGDKVHNLHLINNLLSDSNSYKGENNMSECLSTLSTRLPPSKPDVHPEMLDELISYISASRSLKVPTVIYPRRNISPHNIHGHGDKKFPFNHYFQKVECSVNLEEDY